MKNIVATAILVLITAAAIHVLAQVPTSPPLPTKVLTLTPTVAPIIGSVTNAVDHIPLPAAIPAWIVMAFTFGIEMLMRIIPTAKPRSIFLLGSQLVGLVAKGLQKISDLLDFAVQNIKE